jgi:hypothetical protein
VATAVDWTVDKLLSGIQTLNARAESAQNTIRANRATYLETLRSLGSITDVGAREALRSKLREWVYKQVEVENRFNSFATGYTAAKAAAKKFLTSIGVAAPSYLGALPAIAVPVAVWGGVAIGLTVIAAIVLMNATQSKGIGAIRDLLETARAQNWTAQQTSDALKSLAAAESENRPDILGVGGILKAALPLILIGGALFLFGPALQKRMAA